MDAALKNTEKVEDGKGTKSGLVGSMLTEKQAEMSPKAAESVAASNLPKVEFVISRGQEDSIYRADGSVTVEKSDKKIDPNCKTGVRSADGSEQRFDTVGLCKLTGDVHWGKSNDGVMEISLDKGKVKLGLDKNWQLVSVNGEHSAYKQGDEIKHPLQMPKPELVLASADKHPADPGKAHADRAHVKQHVPAPEQIKQPHRAEKHAAPALKNAPLRLDPQSLDAKLNSGLY